LNPVSILNSYALLPLLILTILTVLYLIALFWLRGGLSAETAKDSDTLHTVSVIVAARNEEGRIESCLKALAAQDYPVSYLEIIIVNDRSTDRTGQIIRSFCDRFRHFRCIDILEAHPVMAPKKWAVQSGITASSATLILTTDADCIPPPGWIRHMSACFTDRVGFVAGFSPLSLTPRKTLFSRLVLLDGLALAGVACAGFNKQVPLTCTARNLGYRRHAFEESGGFESIGAFISGDDDLLMHQIHSRTGWKMVYATEALTHVPSTPVRTLRKFIAQRTRHASKGRLYSLPLIGALAGFYLMNLMLFTAPLLPGPHAGYLALLALKMCGEWFFVRKAAGLLHQRQALAVFPLAALLHIPYVVLLGLWGQIGRFTWKGERYSHKRKQPKNGGQ
jgi:cellulose synthase/poly-beta-1,6-N-acetylglucosamine synthase-like glycosyltransferase